jgi:4-hydroxybenzoyl-CoA reductase subunit beta
VAPGSPRCWAVSSTDLAPALVALGAEVTLASARGARRLPLEDLYADDGMAYLRRRPEEILSAVHLPARARELKSTYLKLRRRESFDFPVLGVAAAVRLSPAGLVEEARLCLGAVASRPLLVPEAAALVGHPLDDEAIARLATRAMEVARPMDNTDLALSFRKRATLELVTAAFRQLRGDDVRQFGLLARRAAQALPGSPIG